MRYTQKRNWTLAHENQARLTQAIVESTGKFARRDASHIDAVLEHIKQGAVVIDMQDESETYVYHDGSSLVVEFNSADIAQGSYIREE